MKKKIVILGSTGSIGSTLIKIILKDKNKFDIKLLTAEKNYKKLINQAKLLNVKNIIISNKKVYQNIIKKKNKYNFKIHNDFKKLDKIIKTKIDYSMCSISGLSGLRPTFEIIKHSKTVAIANKESIICGWNLIKKEIKKHKTNFIPVDSEHFSIWFGLNGIEKNKIDKIFLTASGGPLINMPLQKFKNIKISQALNHPNWKMGKKISIDSATMMNKVFEVIEAKNIFNINFNKIKILVHSKSYAHALLKFNNGLIKIIVHDTNMKIPIFNTLYHESFKNIESKKINLDFLNNLNFKKVDLKKFPLVKIIKYLPDKSSLFETVLVSANDELVDLYLRNKIKFIDIHLKLIKFINQKEFTKYKHIEPSNINEIINLSNYVRLKINSLSI